MRTTTLLFIVIPLIILGCDNQAERDKQALQSQNQELMKQLASKDQYIEDVMGTINEIHNQLESSWSMEKKVMQQANSGETGKTLTHAELKQKVLDRIADINSVLEKNRQRVAALQSRLKQAATQYAGLQEMVEGLKKNIEEREKSIAELQTRVEGLENVVSEKTQVIAARDTTIENQTKQLNTVYYVVGDRDDLKGKGIISKEGGVLWGLLGSTTVLASNFDGGYFQPLDKTKESSIDVSGKIDEIIPKREVDSYSKEETADGHTVLRIVKPDEFWQVSHLVIVAEK